MPAKKSPFPGMDPYLEDQWSDVHATMIVHLREQIQAQLPAELRARFEEGIEVTGPSGESERQTYRPDVFVEERDPEAWRVSEPASPGYGVAEPLVIPHHERPKERHIRIVDTRHGNRVVTAIEVLSPHNKIGSAGRDDYQRRQRDYIDAGINLVEIDLIRRGDYVLSADELDVPSEWKKRYLICVFRATTKRRELYSATIRELLPGFRVPLRPDDEDIVIQLQEALDRCHEAGRYAEDIDYAAPLDPALDPEDVEWLRGRLEDATS